MTYKTGQRVFVRLYKDRQEWLSVTVTDVPPSFNFKCVVEDVSGVRWSIQSEIRTEDEHVLLSLTE